MKRREQTLSPFLLDFLDKKRKIWYNQVGLTKTLSNLNDNPFRYCGEYYDSETGTYYLRARYYDLSIGRFLAADTHWNVANMLYGDNPTKRNDRLIPDRLAIRKV